MLALILSMVNRLITAISTPFRMLIVKTQRMFNINVISGKLIQPLTKNVSELMSLRPSGKSDYVKIGKYLVFKKLFAFIVFVACAGVFLYFQMFAGKVEAAPVSLVGVKTNIDFRYDDMALKDFTGVANIRSFDGGIVYTGEIVGGVCKGNGQLFARDGRLIYDGAFDNNKYHGYGIRYHVGGSVEYEGEFADNVYAGTGMLYNARGTLVYAGGFAAGQFAGGGTLFDESGSLHYEGQFAAGQKHGAGTQFHPGGALHYRGEFINGAFHGRGSLYDTNGRLFYTGSMHGGSINYRAFIGSSLADVEAAFQDPPIIIYQEDGNTCFFFEQAGVAVTTDCRVIVHEWEQPRDNPSEGFYYMPEQLDWPFTAGGPSAGNGHAPLPPAETPQNGMPGFVERTRHLYFEIDRDVWLTEQELDKTKISVRRVTVIGGMPPPETGLTPIEDNGPPRVEDCVAIDYIRRHEPTAFPNVMFEVDKQNRLFQRVWNINHADRVIRRAFLSDDVTLRFAYQSGGDTAPAYFTIES